MKGIVLAFERRSLTTAAAWTLVALVLLFSSSCIRENTMLHFFPSPERAYAYGARHFNAAAPYYYDIDHAEAFFKESLQLNPLQPYAHHQLARIAFLRGDFDNAMWNIDRELEIHQNASPSSYYIRGLIEGYMGRYDDAAKDYEVFLRSHPSNWAAVNDYAWVLLKAKRYEDAASASAYGLSIFPDNPWLLNSYATASFELHHYQEAYAAAQKANEEVQRVTEAEWLIAYPGNDPKIAREGIESFKKAVSDNMHTIVVALASSTIQ